MTTIREAAEARARAEGFREAGTLLRALADAGLSAAAIAGAMTAQTAELDAAADLAEREAREITNHRAEVRGAREAQGTLVE